jgi:uncharacterized membrane protein
MSVHPPRGSAHPALAAHLEKRSRDLQNRVADTITRFAGSMLFVYVHVVWFALWLGLGVEDFPYGLLTMLVSLEAIFLSTFVLVSQNRADAVRQVVAEHQYGMIETEGRQNEDLLRLSRQILALTEEVHRLTVERRAP